MYNCTCFELVKGISLQGVTVVFVFGADRVPGLIISCPKCQQRYALQRPAVATVAA